VKKTVVKVKTTLLKCRRQAQAGWAAERCFGLSLHPKRYQPRDSVEAEKEKKSPEPKPPKKKKAFAFV
jgi:hypothetical protein